VIYPYTNIERNKYMSECLFCKPKKKDWEEKGFYGYRCPSCQGPTAFVISSEHRGKLNEEEKLILTELCKKHYPGLKLKWISEKRSNITHFYDFLIPIK